MNWLGIEDLMDRFLRRRRGILLVGMLTEFEGSEEQCERLKRGQANKGVLCRIGVDVTQESHGLG